MKRLTLLGLALVCAAMTFGASTSQAQGPKKPSAPSAKQLAAQHEREMEQNEARAQGMKMAPAMIAAQHLSCTLSDARFIVSIASEVDGKSSPTSFVEVACENSLGYVVGKRKDGLLVSYDCIEVSAAGSGDGGAAGGGGGRGGGRGGGGGGAKPSPLRCTLPANSKPYLALQPQLAASGSKCAITQGAYFGMTPTASVYEVACADADGLLLTVPKARTAESALKTVPCYVLMQADKACTLTKPEQSASYIATLALKAPKPCAATASRLVGQTKAGESFYEFACPDGSGFLVEADVTGTFMRDISCDQAKPLGGCTLTGATATAAAPRTTPSAF